MATKAELEAAIDSLTSVVEDGFAGLTQVVADETQQVLDAIAAGADLTDVTARVTTLRDNLTAKFTDLRTDISDTIPDTDPA